MKIIQSHYKDEVLTVHIQKNEKGQTHGVVEHFFSNKKKYSQAYYKNDVCHGIYQSWWQEGHRYWMDTNKKRTLNGIEIIFCYQ